MATADAYIAVFDAKYAFNFWRPITAIRNGEVDGNDATSRDPAWESVIETPLHPEYPCPHCITSAAARAVLEAEFGSATHALSMTSPTAPGVERKLTSIKEFAAEVSAARICGGIHYRNSTEVAKGDNSILKWASSFWIASAMAMFRQQPKLNFRVFFPTASLDA